MLESLITSSNVKLSCIIVKYPSTKKHRTINTSFQSEIICGLQPTDPKALSSGPAVKGVVKIS